MMAKDPVSIGDVLNKVSVKDTIFTVSILGLAWNAFLTYNTLKATAHQHKDEFVAVGSGSQEIPFGFQAAKSSDEEEEDEEEF